MESRYSKRRPMSMDIVISASQLGMLDAKTLDVSMGGMFVETNDSNSFKENELVDIWFYINCDNKPCRCEAKAIIVHMRDRQIGLKFKYLDGALKQKLRKVLYGYATVSQRAYMRQVFDDHHEAVGL